MMPGWMSSMIKRLIQRSTELQTWNYNHKKQNKIVKTSWDVKQENKNLCQRNVKMPNFILRIIIPNIVEKLKEMWKQPTITKWWLS